MNLLVDGVQWVADSAHWWGPSGIGHRLIEHVLLSAVAVAVAAVVAVPSGIALAHLRRGATVVLNVANVGRAIPSFAILVMAVLTWGIGWWPPFVALVALAIPPMLTNAFIGVRGVDVDVREAATGMGLTSAQVLRGVDLPLAMPLVLAGVRTAAVQVVATATLAAVVAAGGLGRFIVDGFALQNRPMLVAGGLLVAALAFLTEGALAMVERVAVPPPLRPRRDRHLRDPQQEVGL